MLPSPVRTSWTEESEGAVSREIAATGRSFVLAASSERGCGWWSHISLASACEWELGGFVEQAGATLKLWHSFARVVARSSLRWKSHVSLWRSEGESSRPGSRLRLTGPVVPARGSLGLLLDTAHTRHMSSEDRLLSSLPRGRSRRQGNQAQAS